MQYAELLPLVATALALAVSPASCLGQQATSSQGTFSKFIYKFPYTDREASEAISRGIRANEAPGTLQVEVFERAPGVSPTWKITFRMEKESFELTPLNLPRLRDSKGNVDIPISAPGPLQVIRSAGSPALWLLGIKSYSQAATGLWIHENSKPKYFDRDFSTDPGQSRLARAVVLLEYPTLFGVPARCTAFQIAKQLFITNWHCASRNADPYRDGSESTLVFGATVERPNGLRPGVRAQTLATGETPGELLDFAILQAIDPVPSEYQADVLPLADDLDAAWLATSPAVEMYQQWTVIANGSEVGKASSANSLCRITTSPPQSICHRTDFVHRCNSESGSSGAPILHGGRVVALHYAGTEHNANCAVKASELVSRLRKLNLPELSFLNSQGANKNDCYQITEAQ